MSKRIFTCAAALSLLLLCPLVAYAESDSYRGSDEIDSYFDEIDFIKNSGTMRMNVGDTLDMASEMIFNFQGVGKVTWTSSRPEIATVSSSGKVTAKSDGRCRITATYNDARSNTRTNTMWIRVGTGPASVDAPAAYSLIMEPGEFLMVGELVFPGYKGTIRWSTSDGKVAGLDKGRLTAEAFGNCTITGAYTGADGAEITREVGVRVVSSRSTVKRPYTITLQKGDSADLRAALHPYFTQDSTYGRVYCSTSDADVVSADGYTVKAVGAGSCTVFVRHQDPAKGYETTLEITVRVPE